MKKILRRCFKYDFMIIATSFWANLYILCLARNRVEPAVQPVSDVDRLTLVFTAVWRLCSDFLSSLDYSTWQE